METEAVRANSNEILQVFGRNVQRAREIRQYTLLKLAQISGYDRQYISALELGEKDIQFSTAVKIARALNVSLCELFSREFDNRDSEVENEFIEDDFLLVFGVNVRKRLDVMGKKEIYIYTQTGMDPATVNRTLNKRTTDPRISSLAKIAAGIDADLSDLLSRAKGG